MTSDQSHSSAEADCGAKGCRRPPALLVIAVTAEWTGPEPDIFRSVTSCPA